MGAIRVSHDKQLPKNLGTPKKNFNGQSTSHMSMLLTLMVKTERQPATTIHNALKCKNFMGRMELHGALIPSCKIDT
jgi:hypothetical protein